jgi:hypothetical protein
VAKPIQHPVQNNPPKVVKAPVQVPQPSVPNPEQIKAAQRAQQQAQLAQSLSFLSPSKNRIASAPVVSQESVNRKYAATARGMLENGSKSSVLSNMASRSGSDGEINTRTSRNMSSDGVPGGTGRHKGLNEVQGRVSLAALGGGGDLGSSLSGRGISMSGAGHISEAAVEKALSRYLEKFQYCYEKALLSDSTLAGNILMQWVISQEGVPESITVVRSQMNNQKLHQCISKILSGIKFPTPQGGAVTIKYPFAFSPSSL